MFNMSFGGIKNIVTCMLNPLRPTQTQLCLFQGGRGSLGGVITEVVAQHCELS